MTAPPPFATLFRRHYDAGRCAPRYQQHKSASGGAWQPHRFIDAFTAALSTEKSKQDITPRTLSNWLSKKGPGKRAMLDALLAVLFDPHDPADHADCDALRQSWEREGGHPTLKPAAAMVSLAEGEVRTSPESPWEVRGQGKAGGLVEFVLPPPRPDNEGGSLVTGTLLLSEVSHSAPHPCQPEMMVDFCIGLRGAEIAATANGGVRGLEERAKGSHPHLEPTGTGWLIHGPTRPLRGNILHGDVIDERQLVRLTMDHETEGSATFEVIAQAGAFTVLPPRFVNEPMPDLTDNKQALVSAFLEKRFQRGVNGMLVLARQKLVWRGQS